METSYYYTRRRTDKQVNKMTKNILTFLAEMNVSKFRFQISKFEANTKFRSLNVKNASYFELDLFKFVSDFVLRISSLPTRSG